MNFQGELLHGGLVVLERVAGLIGELTQPDGSTAWSGAFLISPGQHLRGGDYTLRLDDGSMPVIRLGNSAATPSLAALVSFKVSGSMVSGVAV